MTISPTCTDHEWIAARAVKRIQRDVVCGREKSIIVKQRQRRSGNAFLQRHPVQISMGETLNIFYPVEVKLKGSRREEVKLTRWVCRCVVLHRDKKTQAYEGCVQYCTVV